MVAISPGGHSWKVVGACWLLLLVFLTGCWPEPAREQTTPHQQTNLAAEASNQLAVPDGYNSQPLAIPITIPTPPAPVIRLSTPEVYPGDFLVVYLEQLAATDEVVAASSLSGINLAFFPLQDRQIALLPVNYRTIAGDYSLELRVIRAGKPLTTFNETMRVVGKQFPVQYLQVTSSQQALRTDELLKEDSVYVNQAKSATAPVPLWQGSFLQPVQGRIATEFGVIRYLNQVESGRHSGIDLAAAKGTPVQAANTGRVVLARAQHATGNTVIIDHGLNLFTAYSHLDQLLVQPGATVNKGEVIGKVGSTGFSTGPHLHWTVSIGLVFVNPWLFLEQDPLESNSDPKSENAIPEQQTNVIVSQNMV